MIKTFHHLQNRQATERVRNDLRIYEVDGEESAKGSV